MHQQTAKNAIPKAHQRHKNNHGKETMGGHRSRSPSPKPPAISPETFWNSLALKWNSYSRKQKVGLIIVGLVACGLTVYLATQLASSMYVQFSAQLDKEGPLQKNYPEFRKGTTAYSKQDAAAMEKGYKKTQAALRTVLEKSRTEKVVIGVGETHDSSFFQRINILNVVKQHQLEHPETPVTVVTEIPAENVKTAKETQDLMLGAVDKLNDPVLSRLDPPAYKKHAEKFFTTLPTLFPERRQQLAIMSMIATRMYGFDQVVSEGHPPLTTAQQQTMVKHSNVFGGVHIILSKSRDHKTVEVFSDHPLSHYVLQQIDRALTITTRNGLRKFKQNGIVITFLGTAHLSAYADTLKRMGVPHELLHLQHPHKHLDDYMPLRELCFLPFDQCPQPLQEEAMKKSNPGKLIQYCGIPKSDPAAKKCDAYLEEKAGYFGNGSAFNLNMTNQIPETLSQRAAKTIYDFFTTVKAFAKSIDEALNFPGAEGAPIPPKLFELYPEFVEGTDDHEEEIKPEMEKGFRAIDSALYDFLRTPSEKSKVVALFETKHHETIMFKTLLFAYLKLFSNAKKSDVTLVKEFISSPNDQLQFMDLYNQMVSITTSETLTREIVETNAERLCFDHPPQTGPMRQRLSGLLSCEMQNIVMQGFKLVLAHTSLSSLNRKGKIEIFSLSKGITYSFVHHFASIRKVENQVIEDATRALSKSQPNDIILVIGGGHHAKAIYDALKNSTHPFHALFLDTETHFYPESDRAVTLTRALSRACIIPLKDCPTEVQAIAKRLTIDYCVDNKPYTTERKCDAVFHQELVGTVERMDFNRFNTEVSHIPATLPQRYPQKLTDFFAPKSSVKMLKAKLEQDKKAPENKDNNRMEL